MIIDYPFPYWLLFFIVYCFLGWCIESAIVSVNTKKLTNRGFLQGPMLPIYGFGAIMIIFCTLPFQNNLPAMYVVGAVSCTVLEYITAVLMEAVFKTKYWDYSNNFLNFQGRICLVSSLFWGVLTLFVVKVIHRPIAAFAFERLSLSAVVAADVIVCVMMLTDLYFSARAAFELSEIVAAIEDVNVQLELAKMEAREALSLKAEDWEHRRDEIMLLLEEGHSELRKRITELTEKKQFALRKADFVVRSMIRNNPTAVHKRFAKAYNELKKNVKQYRK